MGGLHILAIIYLSCMKGTSGPRNKTAKTGKQVAQAEPVPNFRFRAKVYSLIL